ncbi:MAG: hypothetical protein Q9227_001681 [Pyrenula ochraceoflavens]
MVTIPSSPTNSTVRVQIIDTTSSIDGVPCAGFFAEHIPGFDRFKGVCYAFLISHTSPDGQKTRRFIFDLGIRKDWENWIPKSVERIKAWEADIVIERDVVEILESEGVDVGREIEGVVWSHAHWDHTGDPSRFPRSVDLIVGPGMREAYWPGWPKNQDAIVLESCFKGREIKEVSFEGEGVQEIGGMKALDYFGDGSFYLLDAPGHAVGHINTLARTTAGPQGDSFIYMAGDSFHHGCELRPNPHSPLPSQVSLSNPIPTSVFQKIHPYPDRYATTHFINPASISVNVEQAIQTIAKIQKFDADESVLVIAAHDTSMFDDLPYFPKDANGWRSTDVKEKTKWLFLKDFEGLV